MRHSHPHLIRFLILAGVLILPCGLMADPPAVKRIGIIGPESNHAVNFTKIINDPQGQGLFAEYQVVVGYPKTQPGIESKPGTIAGWDKLMPQMGVELTDSMQELLKKCDYVMVLANDGHPHLAHALPAMRAGKRLYIDKPVAANLKEVILTYKAAEHFRVPLFSSSSLRFTEGAAASREGKIGPVLGADTYSPASLEATHTDLFWYGIHGVEPLFTVMGTGCQTVTRVHTEDFDLVVGQWDGGRIGTLRGTRKGLHTYGGTAFGTKGTAPIGPFKGYEPLVEKILEHFQTGQPPVAAEETLEVYAFMEAADESKRRGGAPVSIKEVMDKARTEAQAALDKLISTQGQP